MPSADGAAPAENLSRAGESQSQGEGAVPSGRATPPREGSAPAESAGRATPPCDGSAPAESAAPGQGAELPGRAGLTSALMLAGLVLVGAAGYYVLAVAGRALGAADASAVAVVYLLANTAGLGLAMALEQETSRAVSNEMAHGRAAGPAIRAMLRLATVIVVAICALLFAAAPWMVPTILNGQWGLFAALVVSIFTFAGLYLVRGVLGGHQRFTGYAATLAFEGLSRLIPLAALELLGAPSAVSIGMIFAAGGAWGLLAALPWLSRLPRTRPAAAAEPVRLGRSFGLLFTSAMLTQVMANIAPVIAVSRLTSEPALGAVLASAFVLARIPLFIFSPIQTILLPRLVKALAAKDSMAMRTQLTRALGAVALLGAVGIAAAALVGGWVLESFFGARVPLPGLMLPTLAAGTVLMMSMQVLQPALLAAGRHDRLLGCWLAGSLCMLTTALLLPQPAVAAVAGQLIGSAVVVAAAAVALSWPGRGGLMVAGGARWSRESV